MRRLCLFVLSACAAIVACGRLDAAPTHTAAEINAGRVKSAAPVRLEGVIDDAFPDETDRQYVFLVLRDETDTIYVTLIEPDYARLAPLVGARVSISGCVYGLFGQKRVQLGHSIALRGLDAIKVLEPAPDPFSVPVLEPLVHAGPTAIARLGRRRTTGRVLATWKPNAFLMRTTRIGGEATNMVMRVECTNEKLPACGDSVEVSGLPETDLYRINLTRAIWRGAAPIDLPPETIRPVTARTILTGNKNGEGLFYILHGETVRLKGIVRTLPNDVTREPILHLEDDGILVAVDVSTLAPQDLNETEIGSIVEVTGVCIFDLDNWRPNAVFPPIKGFRIVPRAIDDLRVIATPPWWTPTRLFSVIGSLAALLVAIILWNVALRRRAEQRGRELAAESVARAESDLKILERTRLAVELHDSIAQYMTGSSMEIRTAIQSYKTESPDTEAHLGLALKAIDASRSELRNCIWDLRNHTLESQDPNDAIRTALAPHLGDTKLTVRFNIPRERLRDDTMHAILSIVRELTVNAIRHGEATEVWVAAAIDNGYLLCSVRDNGHGFSPESAPGMEEGHFGLQGIRERLKERRGKLVLTSEPGKGTKATVFIELRNQKDE